MWAICELITNYALMHTHQLCGIRELTTSEAYFHVALAEQLSVFKSSPISPQPPTHPHLLGNCLLLDSPPPSPGISVALRGGGVDISGTTHCTCALVGNAGKV